MVERRTPVREVGGSILAQVAGLCPGAKYLSPKSTGNSQEAVTEKLFTGTLSINETKHCFLRPICPHT